MSFEDALDESFLAELNFESEWALAAWNGLVRKTSEGDVVFGANPMKESLYRWSLVDQMLTHIVRIDRILNPDRGRDSKDSFEARSRAADRISKRPGLSWAPPSDVLRRVRNWVEHANEVIPNFLITNPGKSLGPFSVGPEAGPSTRKNYLPLRSLNTETWACEVLGESLNLKGLADAVRLFRFGLPSPGVTPKLGPKDIPHT